MPANPHGLHPVATISEESDRDHVQFPLNGKQVIVTSYQFQCCGTITAWRTFVDPSGGSHRNGVYSINFQVWRPSTPGVDDGCYIMAGEDTYENIILLEETRGLVNRTVPQSANLTVQPGDVIGFFAYAPDSDDEDGIQFIRDNEEEYDEVQAWYNEMFLQIGSENCPISIGSDQILSGSIRAAPLFFLDIRKLENIKSVPYFAPLFT